MGASLRKSAMSGDDRKNSSREMDTEATFGLADLLFTTCGVDGASPTSSTMVARIRSARADILFSSCMFILD